MQKSDVDRLVKGLLNLGAELRTLSFAVTTPPVPSWFKPAPKAGPRPQYEGEVDNLEGHKAFFEWKKAVAEPWEEAYDQQRLTEWPDYWINLRIANLTRRSTAGRLPI